MSKRNLSLRDFGGTFVGGGVGREGVPVTFSFGNVESDDADLANRFPDPLRRESRSVEEYPRPGWDAIAVNAACRRTTSSPRVVRRRPATNGIVHAAASGSGTDPRRR